jgi:hypothetical protein
MQNLKMISLFLILSGCGAKHTSYGEYFPVSDSRLQTLLNKDSSTDIAIYNAEYPISLQLYSDGSFRYEIPDYHSASGKWLKMKDGIHLIAQGKYDYEIVMDIRATDAESKNLNLIFQDRFHLKNLKLAYKGITP